MFFYRTIVIVFVFSFFGWAESGFAQSPAKAAQSSCAPDTAERTLIVSLNYGTDRVNNGRIVKVKDSTVMLRYISPDIYYEGNSGFFTDLSFYRLTEPVQSWDETDASLGWEFIMFK